MRKLFSIFIVISFFMCAIDVPAQENGQPVFQVETGSVSLKYIREWLVLGPFHPNDLAQDFLLSAGGEADVEPEEGNTVALSNGGSLVWRRYTSETDKIDLIDAIGANENAVAYGFCILKSGNAGKARFYAGSDDGISVWINGSPIHRRDVARALIPDRDLFAANLRSGENRCLVKVSQGTEAWGFSLRVDMSPANPAVISGRIADEAGHGISDVTVYLEQDGKEAAQTHTDESGNYRMLVYPARGRYDLYAIKDGSGALRLGIPLGEGQERRVNLTLKSAVRIEGRVLMLDDKTPHVACVVQAVVALRGDISPKPVATALTDKTGKYELVNLKPGSYQVRCHVQGGYLYYRQGRNFVSERSRATPLRVRSEGKIRNIDFRFAPLKKGTWKTYNSLSGLAFDVVRAVHRAPDGAMWFGTDSGGISRYDGKNFINFTGRDGAPDIVTSIEHDSDGDIWFGGSGLVRYRGRDLSAFDENITIFGKEDGFTAENIQSIWRDSNGTMWFGTKENGVFRYEGNRFTSFTTDDGLKSNSVRAICSDANGVLWFGTEKGVCRYDGREFASFPEDGKLLDIDVRAIHIDSGGVMWFGTWDDGVFRHDGIAFTNLTTKDGLPDNEVLSIHSDSDGTLWFGTKGGASRYDGRSFINFTEADCLLNNTVSDIESGADGVIWFATSYSAFSGRGGVSRYDSREIVSFTEKDGFPGGFFHRDPDGTMWFRNNDGIFRYDGEESVNITEKVGLIGNSISTVYSAPGGDIWIGTESGDVSRYDGEKFETFALIEDDGQKAEWIWCIHRDPQGVLWFGTLNHGVFRYDGEKLEEFIIDDGSETIQSVFAIGSEPNGAIWFGTKDATVFRYDRGNFDKFSTESGLSGNMVSEIYRDPQNNIWFGIWGGGIYRYDGNSFTGFTKEDGLASNFVFTIKGDSDGNIWVGTDGGGLSWYNGTAWTSLDTREGLLSNEIKAIHRDPDGSLWLGSDEGFTVYRRSEVPPVARILSVTTDREYSDIQTLPEFAMGSRVTIGYTSIDFRTLPEKRQYRYRVYEAGDEAPDYSQTTKETTFDWVPEKPGTYKFEVQAINRDLSYSEPASLSIDILPPPFYRTGIFLIALAIVGGASLCGFIILAANRIRASRAERLRLKCELEDAHKMQSRLLPESAPSIDGFEIAGFSKPAREVGGDFYDYLPLVGGRTAIAVADVSDKGLKGAMNAVMANGMLHEAAKSGTSCGNILSAMNADLYPRIDKHMFAALGLAVLERDGKTLYWANAAQPYPMIKRNGQVIEIKNTSELPLGMVDDVTYSDWEMDLHSGDVIVFYTDGIIESENEAGEMYGIERMEKSVAGIESEKGAEEIIRQILGDVNRFVGDAEQYDDMTIVVVKKLYGISESKHIDEPKQAFAEITEEGEDASRMQYRG